MQNNVIEWLEKNAKTFPDKTAFTDESSSISFLELKQKALASATLICKKALPKTPVAFYLEKCTDAVCTMMGTAYAGCFYSFIDVRQPQTRAKNVLETLKASIIITNQENEEKLCSFYSGKYFLISDLFSTEINNELIEQRKNNYLDVNPLYVNFTSGSTGNPKGVTISHRSVIDFIPVFCKELSLTSEDSFANQAPFDFDVSVKDIYSGLYLGATVHLIPREFFSSPIKLMDFLDEKKPSTLIWAVSALCFVSIMKGLDYKVPDSIKNIMFSGEIMPVKQLHVWQKFIPQSRYINLYGPTEITCNCTYYILNKDFEETETIPIGKAFKNEKVFLLDEEDKLITEKNIPGEICVSGSCVGLGYYNNIERTQEAFVQNPLNPFYNEIIYRTGDLGKYADDENLIYIGRKDFQIKHMGHRIELGEIETAAMSIKDVSRACCLFDSDKGRLILFYTGNSEKAELLKQLRSMLPPFMIPSTVKNIDEMPLNKNGKIDRKQLFSLYKDSSGGK